MRGSATSTRGTFGRSAPADGRVRETGTAGEKPRVAHLGRMAAQDFLAGDTAEQLCVELRAYRRLQHVADMLHKQPQVALLAQWQQLGEFVKEMRAQDARLLHTQLLTK